MTRLKVYIRPIRLITRIPGVILLVFCVGRADVSPSSAITSWLSGRLRFANVVIYGSIRVQASG